MLKGCNGEFTTLAKLQYVHSARSIVKREHIILRDELVSTTASLRTGWACSCFIPSTRLLRYDPIQTSMSSPVLRASAAGLLALRPTTFAPFHRLLVSPVLRSSFYYSSPLRTRSEPKRITIAQAVR